MEKSRNLGPLVIILIVLLVAVGADMAKEGGWRGVLSGLGLSEKEYVLEHRAPEGGLIEGFPAELLSIVRDAEVIDSAEYRGMGEKEGYELLTATYTTKAPTADLFAAYVNYMSDSGYQIIRADAKRGITLVEARGPRGLVSVEISARGFRTNEVEVGVLRP